MKNKQKKAISIHANKKDVSDSVSVLIVCVCQVCVCQVYVCVECVCVECVCALCVECVCASCVCYLKSNVGEWMEMMPERGGEKEKKRKDERGANDKEEEV